MSLCKNSQRENTFLFIKKFENDFAINYNISKLVI